MLFRIKILILVFLTILNFNSFSQNYNTQTNQIFAYNILLNGFVGGIGGAINKKPNEKILKVFVKNFLIGSLGGLIKYTAKQELYSLKYQELSFYAKPNRLLFFLGQSMVNNATLNRGILPNYTIQFYGVNLDFYLKEKFSVKTKLSVLTINNFLYYLRTGNHFNLNKTLEYGVFYFDQNKNITDRQGSAVHNVIAIQNPNNNDPHYWIIPHEMVHTYQNYDYFLISNFFYPRSFTKLKSLKSYKFIDKYFLIEIPFYFGLLYALQPKPAHYKNFYEFEAQHFGTRDYIQR